MTINTLLKPFTNKESPTANEMTAREILKALQTKNKKNDWELFITNKDDYSYSYMRFIIYPNENGYIEFSDTVPMKEILKKNAVTYFSLFDKNKPVIAKNIDTGETFSIVTVDADVDPDYGTSIYLYIN